MAKCKVQFEHFTKEQVQELSVQLAALSKKDTDFKPAEEITGDEQIAIVQNGDNALADLSDVAHYITELSPIRYHNSTYWESHSSYIPIAGEIVIYSDKDSVSGTNIPGIKIGDGSTSVGELAFVADDVAAILASHISNTDIHVTAEDKETWNSKVDKYVDDLVNYYLKSDVYTKEEVQQIITALGSLSIVYAEELPEASAETLRKIYLVPSEDPGVHNVKEEYITIDNGAQAATRYTWEQIGSTAVDISGFVRFDTVQSLTDSQKTQARENIGAVGPYLVAEIGKSYTQEEAVNIFAFARTGGVIIGYRQNDPSTKYYCSGADLYYNVHFVREQGGVVFEAKLSALQNSWTYTQYRIDDVIRYTSQSLTTAQKAQACANIGAAEIFVATYGTTTFSEIWNAYGAGKLVLCSGHGLGYLIHISSEDEIADFLSTSTDPYDIHYLQVSQSSWSERSIPYEKESNKISSWSNVDQYNIFYPSAKLVYDSIQAVDQVFWATIGTTTYANIIAAYTAGKTVFAKDANNNVYYLGQVKASEDPSIGNRAIFYTIDVTKVYVSTCSSLGTWSTGSYDINETFRAVYGTTTYNSVVQAFTQSKLVFCIYGDRVYTLDHLDNGTSSLVFNNFDGTYIRTISVDSSSAWSSSSEVLLTYATTTEVANMCDTILQ